MTRIRTSRVTDFAALGERWRALEARAACSFFQTWTWTGCLARERFPDPILVEALDADETVALALFNRRRGFPADRLFLGESGDPALDRVYIEYNDVLTVPGREAALASACLRAARHGRIDGERPGLPRDLVLSGMPGPIPSGLGGVASIRETRRAPHVDLMAVRAGGGDYLARRSANTRQQLRRSDRAFAAAGPLRLHRAGTVAEAHEMLDAMIPLHQAAWTARGEPGCFADPFFARFHHALIERGMERGEIDLLRVEAGPSCVGILYNFAFRDHALAYQSGFDYAAAEGPMKPGLTCHHQAILSALARGMNRYDFLAGDDRYKRSLSDGDAIMSWFGVDSIWSPRRTGRCLAAWLRRRAAA